MRRFLAWRKCRSPCCQHLLVSKPFLQVCFSLPALCSFPVIINPTRSLSVTARNVLSFHLSLSPILTRCLIPLPSGPSHSPVLPHFLWMCLCLSHFLLQKIYTSTVSTKSCPWAENLKSSCSQLDHQTLCCAASHQAGGLELWCPHLEAAALQLGMQSSPV